MSGGARSVRAGFGEFVVPFETAEIELTDQIRPLTVEFNDTGVTAAVRVSWKLKDLSDFQTVPAGVSPLY